MTTKTNNKPNTNTKTLLTIKTDKKLKLAAQKRAQKMGIPLGTFINMSLRQFVFNPEVTFTVGYTPNAKTIQAIIQANKDFDAGRLGKPAKSINELIKRLNT